jgi:hypothetical protein
MSPRRNWDSPNPFAASECALPPGPKGGGGAHPPAPKGVGEFQSQRWRKSLALCLLCAHRVSQLNFQGKGSKLPPGLLTSTGTFMFRRSCPPEKSYGKFDKILFKKQNRKMYDINRDDGTNDSLLRGSIIPPFFG